MKKQWQKPELIVLVRSKPEEAILTVCKGNMVPNPAAVWDDCQRDVSESCPQCEAIAPS